MSKIIENSRRIVKLSTDDVLNVVRQYQQLVKKSSCYDHTREIIEKNPFFIPEDM